MEYRKKLPSKYFADRDAQAEAKMNVDIALLEWADKQGLNVIFNISVFNEGLGTVMVVSWSDRAGVQVSQVSVVVATVSF
jgi:hypothetical protein